MPSKRRMKTRSPMFSISDQARVAFKAGDYLALHAALGLKPWQVSPLDADGECPYPLSSAGGATWGESQKLRQELLKLTEETNNE